jgi:hypothetical protein
MDPVTVGAVLLAVVAGASEALGGQLWATVAALVRRSARRQRLGRDAAIPESGKLSWRHWSGTGPTSTRRWPRRMCCWPGPLRTMSLTEPCGSGGRRLNRFARSWGTRLIRKHCTGPAAQSPYRTRPDHDPETRRTPAGRRSAGPANTRANTILPAARLAAPENQG